MPIHVRPLEPADRSWLRRRLDEAWGGPFQAYGGELVDAASGAGLLAVDERGERLGILLHRPLDAAWEVVLLEALRPGEGIGTALLDACLGAARDAGARALTVTTTNDNAPALQFYQRRGFRLVALRPAAVDEARRALKPTIPEVGLHGIPIRDEIDLRRDL